MRRLEKSFFCILDRGESSSGLSAAAAAEATDCAAAAVPASVGSLVLLDRPSLSADDLGLLEILFFVERGVEGPARRDDEGSSTLSLLEWHRDDDARVDRGVVGCLLPLPSSRLSLGLALIFMLVGATGDLIFLPFLRDLCFILDGLMTFSRVIGEEDATAFEDLLLIGLELLLSSKVKFLEFLIADGPVMVI